MGLFMILRALLAPFDRLSTERNIALKRTQRERSLDRVPPHLRDDIVDREKPWRFD